MDIQTAIKAVTEHRDLSESEMTSVMRTIMTGEASPAQIGGFLIGLRMKGETVGEITAAAQVMRELATHVTASPEHLVDTCGTGGDGVGTFNVSTSSAFVAAAAGAKVAKHGNRSASSKSGSADVLEAAGVKIDLEPEQTARCIEEVGVGFMFAPKHHAAMRHVVGARKEMGVRTVFNILGPLTNPAGAPNQVIGVFAKQWVSPMAQVLSRLGSRHVLVVHSADGLDELSVAAPTSVAEARDGELREYQVTPEQLGVKRDSLDTLYVSSPQESLAVLTQVLANQPGPARDIVAMNAGAAVYAAGVAPSLEQGVKKALEAIESGAAKARLEALVELSNSF